MFVVPALNLGGIPPFSGFIGKVALLEAGSLQGSVLAWALVAGGTITSLLTLYAVARVWTKAFWRPRSDARRDLAAAAQHFSTMPRMSRLWIAQMWAEFRPACWPLRWD